MAEGGEARAIQVLPDHVIDQIAAGEVIERPASVVKELVENALDAGARQVTVEIERGGRELIRVLDDGAGMTAAEARLALVRHATSKLRDLDDLTTLTTMGFRGEALPSIAAVSRMVLLTRARGGDGAGVRLAIEAGRITAEQAAGSPIGTQIEVRDLLFNLPARLKFMKGEATETAHVGEAVTRLAMAYPAVHFRLRSRGRVVLDAPPHASGHERAGALLGPRLAGGDGRRLHRGSRWAGSVAVEAFLGAPELAQTTTRGMHIYVGRRWVRDRGLVHAVLQGYGELVPRGRYPAAVIFVEVDGPEVDVNVHPQKLEVRFADAQAVYAAVRHAVRDAVAQAPWLGEAGAAAAWASTTPTAARDDARGGRVSEVAREYAASLSRSLFTWRREDGAPPGFLRTPPDQALGRTIAGGTPNGGLPVSGPVSATARTAVPDGGGSSWGTAAPAPVVASTPGLPADRLAAVIRAPGRSEARPPASDEAVRFAGLRYLGQLDRTYLVCERDGELVLVDQHAGHERVAFERLRERYRRRAMPRQQLLFPQTLGLDRTQAAAAIEAHDALGAVGFDVEPFGDEPGGGSTLAVKSVPAELRPGEDPIALLRELIDELADRGGSRAVEERVDAVLATIACHSVVRAGDELSAPEVEALFASLDETPFRAHCPHGRPVLLRIRVDEIARRFGRT